MPGKIFISYRRSDSTKDARAIYERLRRDFGEDRVFIDLEGIEPGEDFVEVLERHLDGCEVLVALIGRDWSDARNERGERRLDDEEDFVRIELAAALKRRIKVFPVLLDGAATPSAAHLPTELRSLVRRQAMSLDYAKFDADLTRLARAIRRAVEPPAVKTSSSTERPRVGPLRTAGGHSIPSDALDIGVQPSSDESRLRAVVAHSKLTDDYLLNSRASLEPAEERAPAVEPDLSDVSVVLASGRKSASGNRKRIVASAAIVLLVCATWGATSLLTSRARPDIKSLYERPPSTSTFAIPASSQPDKGLFGRPSASGDRCASYFYGLGGIVQDDIQAANFCHEAGDRGDKGAQMRLGYLYQMGAGGLTQSDSEAVKWYRLARFDDGVAASNLGLMYELGRGGLEKSASEAVHWYNRGAEQNISSAQFNLGRMYRDGSGIEQDDFAAVRWLGSAAMKGDAAAQAGLGWMYEHGRGVDKSDSDAVKWYLKSAEQGNQWGQAYLASAQERGLGSLRTNGTEALRLYRLAATQGNVYAVSALRRLGERSPV
ncbi:MAG: toll/interleukin-1 receptor domain-containing protein [Ginsengibacter sp.]